jgi:hypothetical protein
MQIDSIYSVLVPPLKHHDAEPLQGGEIPLNGELYNLLQAAFVASPKECSIPIMFPSDNQVHAVRQMLQELVRHPSLDRTKELFVQLSTISTHVAGLALCFVMIGHADRKHVLYIARFPATEAIRTQLGKKFRVELVKDIYMKSSRTYKAALFIDSSIANGFWTGSATDKQINSPTQEVARYWIYGFLRAEFEISSKSGSFMFARSLCGLLNGNLQGESKQQLIALSTLMVNQDGRTISMKEMCERIRVPEELRQQVADSLENKAAFQTQFQFDLEEFSKTFAFRSEYLDNGAVLTAPSAKFADCFAKEQLAGTNRIRYATEGILLNVKMKKRI